MAKVNENETIETYRWLTQMERGQNVLFGLRSGMNTVTFQTCSKNSCKVGYNKYKCRLDDCFTF